MLILKANDIRKENLSLVYCSTIYCKTFLFLQKCPFLSRLYTASERAVHSLNFSYTVTFLRMSSIPSKHDFLSVTSSQSIHCTYICYDPFYFLSTYPLILLYLFCDSVPICFIYITKPSQHFFSILVTHFCILCTFIHLLFFFEPYIFYFDTFQVHNPTTFNLFLSFSSHAHRSFPFDQVDRIMLIHNHFCFF